MAARKLLLSLLTGEAHWGPAEQIAGKVLGMCVGGHLHTISLSWLPFSIVNWAWGQGPTRVALELRAWLGTGTHLVKACGLTVR